VQQHLETALNLKVKHAQMENICNNSSISLQPHHITLTVLTTVITTVTMLNLLSHNGLEEYIAVLFQELIQKHINILMKLQKI